MRESHLVMMLAGGILMFLGVCLVMVPGEVWGWIFGTGAMFMIAGCMAAHESGH